MIKNKKIEKQYRVKKHKTCIKNEKNGSKKEGRLN